MNAPRITLVTAMFELGRDRLAPPFRREPEHYRRHIAPSLAIDLPMVIYTDASFVEQIKALRHGKPTQIIVSTRASALDAQHIARIDALRADPAWLAQADWLPYSPQAALAGYNALVMSKPAWLAEQARDNPFGSTHLYWIDAGLGHTVDARWLLAPALQQLGTSWAQRFLLLCYPYDHGTEIHGFDRVALAERTGVDDIRWVARGGFFGGDRTTITRVADLYQQALRETLDQGLMGTEESILTLLSYRHPEFFDIQPVGRDGLVGPFFQALADDATVPASRLRANLVDLTETWFVSFNAPRQFASLIASIERAAPELLHTAARTLINNSTELAFCAEYERICARYGIRHIQQGNLGINGARLLAAETFFRRGRHAMVWFEDDMLLAGPNDGLDPCRHGLPRHVADLATTSLEILLKERLDYLMLSFTEVFGAHHEQWGWKNLSPAKQAHYFPGVTTLPPALLTAPRQGRTARYALGEVYYSNWPQLITRRGTKTLLLDERWNQVFEQYWCARSFELLRAGDLRAGVLLASPVNHHRTQFYPPTQRCESLPATTRAPSPPRHSRIFVSIANYRDSETPHTLRSLFAQAAHPERIFAGVFSQVVPGVDDDCLPAGGYPPAQVRELRADARESLGACWARHRILSELLGDEDYVLQIDSHSRFAPGWDDRFIAMLHDCPSPKALLTTYPASYVPPDALGMPCTPVLAAQEFNKAGILLVRGHVAPELEFPPMPLPSAFLSANCLFGPRRAFEQVPYDPYLYFHGEEISLAVRFWTHGWDIFAPNDLLMYTDYSTDRGRPRHWTDQADWATLNLRSFLRLRHLFRLENAIEPAVLTDIARYGFGSQRTLAEFERFADVSFATRHIGERAASAIFGSALV